LRDVGVGCGSTGIEIVSSGEVGKFLGLSGGVRLTVIFTTARFTLPTLELAARLSNDLVPAVQIIVPRPVPYCLPLKASREIAPLVPPEILEFLETSELDAYILVVLGRTRYAGVLRSLQPRSTVLIGGRRRWYLTREEWLERQCRQQGHEVIFVDADSGWRRNQNFAPFTDAG
jgi:hypothetical protein